MLGAALSTCGCFNESQMCDIKRTWMEAAERLTARGMPTLIRLAPGGMPLVARAGTTRARQQLAAVVVDTAAVVTGQEADASWSHGSSSRSTRSSAMSSGNNTILPGLPPAAAEAAAAAAIASAAWAAEAPPAERDMDDVSELVV